MKRKYILSFLIFFFTQASQAQSAWISHLDAEQLVCEGAKVIGINERSKLFRMEATAERNLFPSVQIMADKKGWDLSDVGFVETNFTNCGKTTLEVEFWAVGSFEWDPPFGNISIEPGESKLCTIDLNQRFEGSWVHKVDPANISYLRITLKKANKGGCIEVGPISLKGKSTDTPLPSGYRRLAVPEMADGKPKAGRRVKDQLPAFRGTEVYHSLYLPSDWKRGMRYPIIVEYSGNRWFSGPCHSVGRPESSRMGYGMSEGKGYIWVNAPYVEASKKEQALNGWGDADATADYAVDLVKYLCEEFGGDPSAVIITGFSRGAVACGYIGLRNERIADVWLAFHACQHYDGDGYGNATYETALTERGPRIQGRATFQTDNDQPELHSLFSQLGFPVTFANSELGAHTESMFLEDRPSTLELRQWLVETIASKPGTNKISGRVVDMKGKGLKGVRIQSGTTHFVFTDANGYYELSGLVSGKRTIVASKNKSQSLLTTQLKQLDLKDLDFQLK